MSEYFRNAHKILRRYLRTAAWLIFTAQLFVVVVFPIIEIYLRQQPGIANGVWIVVLLLHGTLALLVLYATFTLTRFTELTELDKIEQAFEEQKVRLKEYEGELATVLKQTAAIQGSLSVLQSLLQNPHSEDVKKDDDIEKLLAPLIKYRAEALGYSSDDFHNFAVYLHAEQSDELEVFFRNCDDRIETTNRSWAIGVGHVGIAFASRRTIISPNIRSEAHKELLGNPTYATDEIFYASFISTPILDPNQDSEPPIGVLVITSSRKEHFGEQHTIFAEIYSLILSMYFYSRN